ncbi:uncharacterized protein LOC143236654 [Tachypleus tridentatus]|uniref:uncharacterized protein LOC143236654 n=1 Tax=Tachypleus tridentatus TaxID=6853 RepID=UPI003FD2557A
MKCLLSFLFVFVTVSHIKTVVSLTCTRENIFGQTTYFHCPQTGDSFDEIYCCGIKSARYCCDIPDLNIKVSPGLIVGIVISVIVFIIIVVVISCFCCSCCILAKRRRQQGIVLSTSPTAFGTSTVVTHSTQVPYPSYQPQCSTASGYPVYPPANTGYPPSYVDKPPSYPIARQPAYNQGY